jgi:hypothetical protein
MAINNGITVDGIRGKKTIKQGQKILIEIFIKEKKSESKRIKNIGMHERGKVVSSK